MIAEDYVSFETTKLLHDKGFNLAEFHGKWAIDYDNVPRTDEEDLKGKIIVAEWQYPLITHQMAMKWLREEWHIFIRVIQSHIEHCTCEIYYNSSSCYRFRTSFDSYEEACESAIKYCLENLI